MNQRSISSNKEAATAYNFVVERTSKDDRVIAIGGNPNVGKSTLFNNLTGLKQHTGNWPGKTVANAVGSCKAKNRSYRYQFVDIPGTYSLMAHSTEERVARNFLCFGEVDAVVVVCDATCLERNLNLVLQTLEITTRVLVCVNMLDEAKRKGICVDLKALSNRLQVPVVGIVAKKPSSVGIFLRELDALMDGEIHDRQPIQYPKALEQALEELEPLVQDKFFGSLQSPWIALKLLEGDEDLLEGLSTYYDRNIKENGEIQEFLKAIWEELVENGITQDTITDVIVESILKEAQDIAKQVVTYEKSTEEKGYYHKDQRIDGVITSKWMGYPIMLGLLALILWITIAGANYPSKLLSKGLFYIGDQIYLGLNYLGIKSWVNELLIHGIYRVLAWVVAVMLPPMAIFFPLFSILEDSGYLPRVAYNMDGHFKRCCACGKQALTMCMGFGCNAAGVIGCRIIDSDRERLLAMLTNNFIPCNGRFPTLIALITMFFVGATPGFLGLENSLIAAGLLTLFILFGIFMTFAVSKLLTKTILKGISSSFTLELPPFRRPQFSKILVRSVFDRTLFVLGRAMSIAAPAGMIIWILANVKLGNLSLLNHCSNFLDPFAKCIGLDGVILLAFILGLPANEIVMPIIIMAYLSQGKIIQMENLTILKQLLVENGWTWVTALCTMIFSLMHWPCSTTLLTIKKESNSIKWTFYAFLIPTLCGIVLCGMVATIAGMIF